MVLLVPGRAASKICLASFMLTMTFFLPRVARLAAKIISLSYFLPFTVMVLPRLFCFMTRLITPALVAVFIGFFIAFIGFFIAFMAAMAGGKVSRNLGHGESVHK